MMNCASDPVLDRLIEGRTRVARGWCIGKLSIATPSGRSYCARGAITTTGDWDGHDAVAREAETILARHLPRPRFFHCGAWVADFNNNGTQAEVVALFDRAIAAREQEVAREAVQS